MLVNKEYLEEAAQAYMKEKTFVFLAPKLLDEALNKGRTTDGRLTRLMSSVKFESLLMSSDVHKCLRQLPKLRFLKLGLRGTDFERGVDKCPEIDEYTDLDFLKIDNFVDLLKVRGLRRVVVTTSEHCHRQKTQQQAARCNRLLVQVEKFFTDVMTRPREADKRDRQEFGHNGGPPSKLKAKAPLRKDAKSNAPSDYADAPLTTADIPKSESAFARLVSTRPQALFEWMRNAAQRLESGEV